MCTGQGHENYTIAIIVAATRVCLSSVSCESLHGAQGTPGTCSKAIAGWRTCQPGYIV